MNRNRKGGKREKRFSGPYTILDISKAGNCTLKHKEGAVKKTKHPLAHLKQYHERNLVVESENEIEENREDRTEVDHILESLEKEESLDFVESLETEENIEEKLQKKGKMDGNWNFAENVMGLVHLKQYHERYLVVESENEIEENREDRTEVDHILESFEKEGSLEFVENLETEENIEEKLQKKRKMDGNWNFAENVMGLVIKDKFKCKRKQNDSTVKKRKVTYLDLSKCVATDEDTLPDIHTEEFSGARRKDDNVGDKRKEFTGAFITGAHITGTLNREKLSVTGADVLQREDKELFTGATPVTGACIVTGAQDNVNGTALTGAQKENIYVTGAHFTGAQEEQEENITFTGGPFKVTGSPWRDVRKTPDRISEARRRLSLSLWKNRVPENSVHEDNEEKLAEYIIVDLSPSPSKRPSPTPSVEVLSDVEEPGLPIPSHYVFIPLGTKIRRQLAPIFGINQMGPLPNYTDILRICEGLPSRVQEIEGNGNCLFNSMSYVLSSYEKFNWKI